MGLYDRDYIRDDQEHGSFLGGQHSMVTTLIFINVGVFIVDVLMEGKLSEHLALQPDLFRKPWNAWQLLTAGFLHDHQSISHIGWNMFELWLFGRDVEGIYGRKEFLRLYLSLIVLSSLVWVIAATAVHHLEPTFGASGAIVGVMILYVLHFPTRTFMLFFVLPVPAWLLGSICIVQNVLGLSSGREYVAHEVPLAGAAFAYLYYTTGWHLGRWLPRRFSLGALKPRPKLRVHEPQPEESLSDQVDRILEKISREGESSLTAQERRTLEDASRRYQQRRR
ncbi:MAG TPA: rhomboid family intramembrane serine protease [Pirellulales bacterium]|nr:rhomboid family intramembrane serine protease [Pirellulales bacterium]